MFSVAVTAMNSRPLCTPNFKPTISGVIVDERDHVLMEAAPGFDF
jgi:hypothetical protein